MSQQQSSGIVLRTSGLFGFLAGIVGGVFSFFVLSHVPQFSNFITPTVRNSEPIVIDSEERGVVELVEKVNPAVVNIIIEKEVGTFTSRRMFDDFLGFLPPWLMIPEESVSSTHDQSGLEQIGGGSGFVVTSDGLIVTNRHVVSDEEAVYTVVLSDGTRHPATVIAKDPSIDVALIRIEADNLPVLELGNSDELRIGQTVLAIGNALAEYGNTLTKGVISGIGRRVEAGDRMGAVEILEGAIQTDAAINPGNSGGPLLDLSGKVIGINTAVSEKGQLVGFAIPINSVRKTIETVEQEGRLVRPWLGVRYIPITPRLAQANNLPVTYGVLVQRGVNEEDLAVIPGSPADKAGIVENDILLSINGDRIEDIDSLSKLVMKYSIGDTIVVNVLHKGEEREVEVRLEEMPEELTK